MQFMSRHFTSIGYGYSKLSDLIIVFDVPIGIDSFEDIVLRHLSNSCIRNVLDAWYFTNYIRQPSKELLFCFAWTVCVHVIIIVYKSAS